MKKVAVFDLDGTLIDSLQGISLACNAALRLSGLPEHETEEYRTFIGNGMDKLIWRALPAEADEKTFLQVKQGTYIIEEISAPDGYVIDGTAQTVYLSGKDQDVVTVTFGNKPEGSLLIKKMTVRCGNLF